MQDHDHYTSIIGEEIHFENLFQFLADIFKHTMIITLFVMIMMLLIEYLTVQTKGNWSKPVEKNPWLQVLFAALMGIIPGCLGVYIVVALFAHRIINFAALVTVMIATSGDEAFIMLVMIPEKALILMGIIFTLSILTGLTLNLFPAGKWRMFLKINHMMVHEDDSHCTCFDPSQIIPQLKKITFERAILLSGGLLFTIFILSGDLGPETWNWKKIIFLIVSLIEVFIVFTVPDHFLNKHLWGHVIRRHFLKVFIWTFGAFLVIHIGLEFLHLEDWLKDNFMSVMIIAVLVGIIPESGPHLIFITLYASGSIPFSILLANSIVQDGHGSLPLLAESQKSFLYMKGINLIIGFIVGLVGLMIGF